MPETKHPSWKSLRDEYVFLSEDYIRMIERSLGGETVDYTSELKELFFWNFGVIPQWDDLKSVHIFYKDMGIPPESRWRKSEGLMGLREWKKEWSGWKDRVSGAKVSVDEEESIRKEIHKCLSEEGHPLHYEDICFNIREKVHFLGDLSPVAVNFQCMELEERGAVEKLAPGIWSFWQFPDSLPVTLREIKTRASQDSLPPKLRSSSLHDELTQKRMKGYTSHTEMEEDVRRIFECLGFDAYRRGGPGESDVVAQDRTNVLVIECKSGQKYSLSNLSVSLSRHVDRVKKNLPTTGKRILYLVVANAFSPIAKKGDSRMYHRQAKYISDAEKAIGVPVIPIFLDACLELIPLSQERKFLPGDIISVLADRKKRWGAAIWWSQINSLREHYGKRLPLTTILDTMFPVLMGSSRKLQREEIIKEVMREYEYGKRLAKRQVQEAGHDLEELLRILEHLQIIVPDNEGGLVLHSSNLPFIKKILEDWLCGEPWQNNSSGKHTED